MRVFVLVFLALAAAASAHDDDYDCGKTPDSPHCVTGVVAEYWRQCQGGSIIYTTKLKLNEQPDVETTEPLLDYSHPTNPKGVKTGWVNPGNGKGAWIQTGGRGRGPPLAESLIEGWCHCL